MLVAWTWHNLQKKSAFSFKSGNLLKLEAVIFNFLRALILFVDFFKIIKHWCIVVLVPWISPVFFFSCLFSSSSFVFFLTQNLLYFEKSNSGFSLPWGNCNSWKGIKNEQNKLASHMEKGSDQTFLHPWYPTTGWYLNTTTGEETLFVF